LSWRELDPSLRLDKFPILRSCDEFISIKLAVAILVREATTGSSHLPIRVIWIYDLSSVDRKMLDITPSKIRSTRALI